MRLKEPHLPADSEIEIDIPIRFYCFVIGPESYKNQLHEIGRALGVLMADDVFHEVAYEAKERVDIYVIVKNRQGHYRFTTRVTTLGP